LQKKCFIASAGLHMLLVLILVVGPAFLSSKNKTDEMPTIDFVPSRLIDAAFSGGGNPNTRPPPPAPPAPAPAPPLPPLQREVSPPEQKPEPKPEPVKPVKPVVESLEARKEPARPKPEITTTAVSRNADSQKKPKQPSEADSRAKKEADDHRKAAAALIASTSRNLRNDLSPATAIDINPGPGGGGEAYANYAQVVKSIYEHAWLPSDDTTSDEAITKVTVTISREGKVLSSRIIKGSGDSSIDRSVQRTLDRVTFIAPFPEGAKDKERTFTINFNLKAKRLAG
jgi:colicin import membrane protein